MFFEINNQKFKTKDLAVKHFSEYFKKKSTDDITDDDKILLNSLLRRLNGDDFNAESFRVILNQYKCFEIQFLDSKTNLWIPFSISRCIVGKPRTETQVKNKTYRQAIEDQIYEFQKCHPTKQCSVCKSYENIEVDHANPIFADIIKKFHIKYEDEEERTSENFALYHRKVANLRYLCKKCNIDSFHRGRKKLYSDEEAKRINLERAKNRYKRILKPSEALSEEEVDIKPTEETE